MSGYDAFSACLHSEQSLHGGGACTVHHSPQAHRFVFETSAGSSLVRRPASTRACSTCADRIDPNLDARTSFLLPFEIVEPLAADRSPRRVRPRKWRHLTRAIITEATPSWPSLRTGLRARISLLPFQLEPALAVTHGIASRLLIADEVGLGKTIQAALIVAEILERTRHARVLIVAPASLKEQWQAELNDRFRIEAWLADSVSLARLGAEWGATNPWTCRPVTITSIDFVKRPEVMRALEAMVWDAVVFDEAHGLTGRSDRARAAGALARRARTVVLLTATPHSGDDRAFETLCGIGDLDRAFPLLTFRRTRRDVGLAMSRKTLSLRVRPTLAEREMHRALQAYVRKVRSERRKDGDAAHLAMMVLTRRACSSASSLFRSIERRLALLTSDPSSMAQLMLPLFESSGDEEPGAELAVPGLDDRNDESRRLEAIRALALRAQQRRVKGLRADSIAAPRSGTGDRLYRVSRHARQAGVCARRHEAGDIARWTHSVRASRESAQFHERRNTRSPCHRRSERGPQPSPALPAGDQSRVAVDASSPRTADRPCRAPRTIATCSRPASPRCRHCRGDARQEAADTNRSRSRSDRDASRSTAGAVAHPRDGGDGDEAHHAPAPALGASRQRRLRRKTSSDVTRRRGHRESFWGFHVSFADSAAQSVWQTLIGASTSLPVDSPASLDRLAALLASTLDDDSQGTLAALEAALKAFLDRAALRERAVARALESERARLSASLLQRGLFDRRAERAFSAQTAVLDEALARCRARLGEIESTGRIVAEPTRLAFALLPR